MKNFLIRLFKVFLLSIVLVGLLLGVFVYSGIIMILFVVLIPVVLCVYYRTLDE